ncbi:RAD protein (Pv-fam-e) [Plasmodium vivax]|uniref:RAD protein (Pv-fam-e) n=4 Tax=Plasmodium vivax TaxID=5855 RepID=A0A0J9THS6_PLAVI|nr:RAD protein (Pv-fam-e) [Plasmodium vivax Brazil I]KMZ94571.1 RAD protein (Pv-fam-e) [Plasmodium vivax Mauritania I]KNA01111.1 RAD protein (Pv-fam-e) [Plasmodium vivax North Korean]CAG9479903.1 unnamed protein product [Plasmodium vivax]CAI7718916.1 Plasmodium exported protein (PHIST), unknown function [Plasmodium vivax]
MFVRARAAFSLFVLSSATLATCSAFPNGHMVRPLAVGAPARKLAELAHGTKKRDPSSAKRCSKRAAHEHTAEALSIDSDDDDFASSEISKLESLIESNSFKLFIKNKSMNTQLRDYNGILSDNRNEMMKKLAKKLTTLASRHGFPEKEKEKLLNECKEATNHAFKLLEDYYKIVLNRYSNRCIALRKNFQVDLWTYVLLWEKAILNNERKWCDTFTRRVSKYKKGAPK